MAGNFLLRLHAKSLDIDTARYLPYWLFLLYACTTSAGYRPALHLCGSLRCLSDSTFLRGSSYHQDSNESHCLACVPHLSDIFWLPGSLRLFRFKAEVFYLDSSDGGVELMHLSEKLCVSKAIQQHAQAGE